MPSVNILLKYAANDKNDFKIVRPTFYAGVNHVFLLAVSMNNQ